MIRNIFLFLGLLLLLGCVNVRKDKNGFYDYNYCIRYITPSNIKITKHKVISKSDTTSVIQGVVFANMSNFIENKEDSTLAIGITVLLLDAKTKTLITSVLTSGEGRFKLQAPNGKYKIIFRDVGMNPFEYFIELKEEIVEVEIKLGVIANMMYGVPSKSKLMRWQIKRKAYKQYNEDKMNFKSKE